MQAPGAWAFLRKTLSPQGGYAHGAGQTAQEARGCQSMKGLETGFILRAVGSHGRLVSRAVTCPC